MGRFKAVGAIMLAIVGFSSNVFAVPSFTWQGPWNVTLLSNCVAHADPSHPDRCTAPGNGGRSFGVSATQDGQIMDTSADTALAESNFFAGFATGSGSTGVTFFREFTLSGSAEGWAVSLSASLNGMLVAGGTNGAGVTAEASIVPSLDVTFHDLIPSFTNEPFGHVVNQSQVQTAVLTDGVYTVAGLVVTGAAGGSGLSFSDASFQVSVSASAVPEPSSMLLLITGLIGSAWAYSKTRAA